MQRPSAGGRNLISGNNGNGIALYNAGISGTLIRGNTIGVAADSTTARANTAAGVWISGSSGNQVDGNLIAFNTQQGIGINSGGSQNRISNNTIRDNGLLGIQLFDTANAGLQPPTLSNAVFDGSTTQVTVSLAALPAGSYSVQFFLNTACDPSGFGEGAQPRGSSTIASPGATVPVLDAVVGQFLTATATDADGNTTAFTNCVPVNLP